MQFEDFCIKARLFRTVSGRAHFVCLINGNFSVVTNPPSWDSIHYTATAPSRHPSD